MKRDNNKKLIIGGIVGGVLIVVMLLLTINGNISLEFLAGNSTLAGKSATATNATTTNATATNATATNATTTNATATNATSANASITDNILYLNEFGVDRLSANTGEKIYVNKNTTGACNSAITLSFKEIITNTTFNVTVESLNENPYFEIPTNIVAGDYKLTDIVIVGLNSDNTTFTKHFSSEKSGEHILPLEYDITINVTVPKKAAINLTAFKLSTANAFVGDDVKINYSANENLNSLKLIFKSNSGNEFTAFASNLENGPHFAIGSNVIKDNYYLYEVILVSNNTTTIYTNGQNYNFNVNLTINEPLKNESVKNNFVYNNEDVTDDIIKEIYNTNQDINVIINTTGNSIVSANLFNSIKGTNKKLTINYKDNQIIFEGKDITDVKSIDTSITINNVIKEKEINKNVKNAFVINFKDNGNLPGKALIRLKITDDMKHLFKNNPVQIYYYDELEKGFNLIKENVKANDNYYEFTIRHNSKYVITKNQIDSSLILKESDDNVVSFQASNKVYILLIGASLLLIAAVIVTIVIIKKKKIK